MSRLLLAILFFGVAMAAAQSSPAPGERALVKEVTVAAPVAEAWKAWTTTEGVTSFFAPRAHVELRVGGPYEMYFSAEAPRGKQGSEGCTIVAFRPLEKLVFTWNHPPHLSIRDQHTRVTLKFQEVAPGRTRVVLKHTGWKEGPEWEQSYQYFDRAWGKVLANLEHRFAAGPIDWATFTWQK
jgi:uncharacterized protein YndB with AHSA1/START domain